MAYALGTLHWRGRPGRTLALHWLPWPSGSLPNTDGTFPKSSQRAAAPAPSHVHPPCLCVSPCGARRPAPPCHPQAWGSCCRRGRPGRRVQCGGSWSGPGSPAAAWEPRVHFSGTFRPMALPPPQSSPVAGFFPPPPRCTSTRGEPKEIPLARGVGPAGSFQKAPEGSGATAPSAEGWGTASEQASPRSSRKLDVATPDARTGWWGLQAGNTAVPPAPRQGTLQGRHGA